MIVQDCRNRGEMDNVILRRRSKLWFAQEQTEESTRIG